MSSTLHQIVTFVDLAPGATATLPHNANINGVPVVPDLVARDEATFMILDVTATDITVENGGPVTTSCNVWVWSLHSLERAFGGPTAMDPRPFIIGGGSGQSGAWSTGDTYEYAVVDEPTLSDLTFDDQVGILQAFHLTVEGVALTITSIDATNVSDGDMLTIYYPNGDALALTFADNGAGVAENRFALPGDADVVVTGTNHQITFRYNGVLSRWTLFAQV